MKQLLIILLIILGAYLLYAFIFSAIIYAFRNPLLDENLEKFTDNAYKKERKNKDSVQLIESAKDGVTVRVNLIENAKNSIDISYFTFRDGKVSRMMLGGILNAANRGVKVRILLDSLSLLPSLKGEYKEILYGLESHKNIDFKFYDPVNPLFPFNWNKRLHDKILIIDDKLALIGGRNIADNYFVENSKGRSFSNDRDVLIFKDDSSGDYHSAIEDMKNYHTDTWNYKHSKPFMRKLSKRQKTKSDLACEKLKLDYIQTKNSYKGKLDPVDWSEHTIPADNIVFIHNPVGKTNHDPWCLRELLFLSSKAQESIFMQSPYVIPTKRMATNFSRYDIDLSKTKILTNSYYSSPNYLSIAAYSNHRNKMIDNKVRFYEYQGSGSLHGKTYIFDNYISAVGSFNLDSRSSYINSEIMIVIYSKEFAHKLKRSVQVTLDQSLEVGKDYSYIPNNNIEKGKVSKLKKLTIVALSKITPILEHLL